eukprot:6431354-Amphidinium_carterae.2
MIVSMSRPPSLCCLFEASLMLTGSTPSTIPFVAGHFSERQLAIGRSFKENMCKVMNMNRVSHCVDQKLHVVAGWI